MKKNTLPEVSSFLQQLEHPLKKEIEYLRALILSVNGQLSETIKWNAPSFVYNQTDCITFKLYPPKKIQLIFHRGAKIKEQPKEKLVEDSTGLLTWKANDRAVATFSNMEAIKTHENTLKAVITSWLTNLEKQ